jgi:hypothetical protein
MEYVILLLVVAFICLIVVVLMRRFEKKPDTAQNRVQDLLDTKYSTKMHRWAAGGEGKAAARRTELLAQLNNESSQLVETINQQANALKADFAKGSAYQDHILDREKKLADHEAYLALAANNKLVANLATQFGTDPVTMREIILEKAKMEIEVNKHKKIKEIDLEARWQEILQDSNAADLALIGDHLVIKKLYNELAEARKKRHAVKVGDDPEELKQDLLADYDKFIQRLEAKIDERETGHILSENREATRGLPQAKANSRTDYPPETDEDSV